ncbi:hypothetical protein CI238_08377, partial [Colletotrichum incanum]
PRGFIAIFTQHHTLTAPCISLESHGYLHTLNQSNRLVVAMAKQKTAPVASPAKTGDNSASATQQQTENNQPATQLEKMAAFLVPPAWARRIVFVAIIVYLTPMLLAHWVETSAKIIRIFQSYTSGR